MDCIFCKIVKGEVSSVKIWEDDEVLAFLDVSPVSDGHTLVIPKKHFNDVFDMDAMILQKVSLVGKNIASILKEKLNADGINFLQSNGKSAGQVIFHYHLHIIPRHENDGLRKQGLWGEKAKITNIEELKKVALQLRSGQAEEIK